MAGASPPVPSGVLPFLLICYALVLCVPASASSFAFNFSTGGSHHRLQFRGDAYPNHHMIELTKNDKTRDSRGWMWYASPVELWNAATGELASFTTTFSFKITNPEYGSRDTTGDGMAFFLAPYSSNDVLKYNGGGGGEGGGFLGLFNDSNKYNATVVAVEFDTFRNKWDDDYKCGGGQHVGIDVNSIWSVASSPVGDEMINLTSNTTMTAKINYDNRTNLLAADLDIDGCASYHVNYTVELKLFLPEKVAVGFSAATAGSSSAELHRISSWSFDSSLESKVVPPASAPSSQKIASPSVAIPPVKSSPELHRILVSSLDPWGATATPDQETPVPGAYEYQPTPAPDYSSPELAPDQATPRSTTPESSQPAPAPDYSSPEPAPTPRSATPEYSPPAPPPPYDHETPSGSTPTNNKDKERQKKLLPSVLAPILAVLVFAIACFLLWLLWQKRRRNVVQQNEAPPNDSEESFDEQHDFERVVAGPRRYHYRELAAATGDFSDENRLGEGGFGSVYQGNLQQVVGGDNKQVAVKLLSSETSSQGRKQFEAEVKIIGQLRHRNLVQLLGWCDSPKGLLLVYELVPQRSLDKHIHSSNPWLLTWPDRYKIIMGLGAALRYLHGEWDQCIVHGDIKPSNIMLDSAYNTKLGDFGLARLVDHGAGPQTTGNIFGSPGYIDPDFVNTRRPSTESDVYSFGIVLLEIVSGRQPVDGRDPSFMLLRWVWSLYSQGKTVEAAELRVGAGGDDERQMERALVVGLWCAHHDPGQRPSVADAMHVLQSEDAKLPVLSPHMYKLPCVVSTGESGGVSGSSFSRGVRSSVTTGTTQSSQSFITN